MPHTRDVILIRPRIQPHPVDSRVAHMAVGEAVVTAITRIWGKGEAAACRLCDACQLLAGGRVCTVLVDERVSGPESWLYSTRGGADVTRGGADVTRGGGSVGEAPAVADGRLPRVVGTGRAG